MDLKYSVVIPVFNSEKTIKEVIQRTIQFFESKELRYEIIAVNDGSEDNSWDTISRLCDENSNLICINLARNFGQHNANLCGFQRASGDYVITMDDDLQNPPEEIEKLISKSREGHDLVIGKFMQKKHSLNRRIGSKIVGKLNAIVFLKPKHLTMTNFRLIRRDIISRICEYKGADPYIPGLVVLYASNPANIEVQHLERAFGKSNYGIRKISKLVFSILFNYSVIPLRLAIIMGLVISILGVSYGSFVVINSYFSDTSVPGWASIVTLMSFSSAFTLLLLGALGEYLIYLIKSINTPSNFLIMEEKKGGK